MDIFFWLGAIILIPILVLYFMTGEDN